jgi:hypothetical protein
LSFVNSIIEEVRAFWGHYHAFCLSQHACCFQGFGVRVCGIGYVAFHDEKRSRRLAVMACSLGAQQEKSNPKKGGLRLREIGYLFDVCWYGNLCWFVFAEFLAQKHFVC